METAWIWKSSLLVIAGMVLLRIAGRKSISQMSVATSVIMISIGTTIVQPIANNHMWIAIGSAAIFIVALLLVEYLQLKINWVEKLLGGRSQVVIENGRLVEKNMRSMRLTVDQLEMRLREKGIANIGDVKTATLEPNGQLGYELMRHAKPVTIGELERILGLTSPKTAEQGGLFQEVSLLHHPKPVDPHLH
ncbi:DUF421 domain-containing protein [Paenibacillus hamazuiensis]|uniref:DUF421 domain-containing protein n=1 Tax=Paenibacillus hamazuiensis TaxID=2936508 RepID=UPI00200C300C|nr:DUF421 domain-containing protein [Paenibacillus hamazuiensis]